MCEALNTSNDDDIDKWQRNTAHTKGDFNVVAL